jgi:hypothetical protein
VQKVATILLSSAVVLAVGSGAYAQPADPDNPETPRSYSSRRSPTPGLQSDGGVEKAPVEVIETEEEEGEGFFTLAGEFLDEVSNTVMGWQKQLTKHMPDVAAWGVISAPLWFVILLTLVRRARRPKHASTARSKNKEKPKADRKSEAERRAEKSKGKAADDTRSKRREKRKTKVQDAPAEVFKPTPVQHLLMMQDGRRPSLLETFCVLGADMDAIVGLRRAAMEELDASMWASAINFKDLEALRPFRKRWVKETAALRIQRWLSEHPFVSRDNLHVTMPARLQLGEFEGMTLTEPSGLGVELEADQQQLIEMARQMLRKICKEAENPYVVLWVAREAEVPELVGCSEDDLKDLWPYRLALLLVGMPALEHGIQARLSSQDGARGLKEALAEHKKLVDTPVPAEGCAVHTLHLSGGTQLEGMETLLAAVAGAAYSANAVVMKISKAAADVPGNESHDALVNLGEMVSQVLADPKSAESVRIADNLKWLVGDKDLKRAIKLAGEVTKGTDKLAAKQAVWEEDTASTPDQACAEIAAVSARLLSALSTQAVERMYDILVKLAYAGQDNANAQIACRRLGYAFAGLGAEVVAGTGTDLLSARREAAGSLLGS